MCVLSLCPFCVIAYLAYQLQTHDDHIALRNKSHHKKFIWSLAMRPLLSNFHTIARGVCGAPLYSDFRTWDRQQHTHIYQTNFTYTHPSSNSTKRKQLSKFELISSLLLYHLALLTSTFTAKILLYYLYSHTQCGFLLVPRRMQAVSWKYHFVVCVRSVAAAHYSRIYNSMSIFYLSFSWICICTRQQSPASSGSVRAAGFLG